MLCSPPIKPRSNYSELAPPHSFIDVSDFASPKDLAERLLFLDRSPQEYLAYFWWQDRFRAVDAEVGVSALASEQVSFFPLTNKKRLC